MKGDTYLRIEEMYRPTRYRCTHCRPKRSELTSSDYYQWLWELQDNLHETYNLRSDGVNEEIVCELESKKEELEERLENMPEQLRDADAGTTLQERIDSLDNAISELQDLEYPDYDEVIENACFDEDEEYDDEYKQNAFEEALDEFESSITDIIENIE